MIITRAPLRISLGGGGTDLPWYSSVYGGELTAAAITSCMCIAVNRRRDAKLLVRTSTIQLCDDVEQVEHPIVKAALKYFFLTTGLEITSMCEVPSGTGLGSSGAFTSALVQALALHKDIHFTRQTLAQIAYNIEVIQLSSPVGWQDMFASCMGGVNKFYGFSPAEVVVQPLSNIPIPKYFHLFWTGTTRRDHTLLQSIADRGDVEEMHRVKQYGIEMRHAMLSDDWHEYGRLMTEHWNVKKRQCPNVTTPAIDSMIARGLDAGAYGAKLIGAGGAGFIMFCAPDRVKLETALNLTALRYDIDNEGVRQLL